MSLLCWVIEDNDNDFQLIRRIIRHYDERTTLVAHTSGEAALEFLLRVTETRLPDLIFLDLNLPNMDGLDFLKALRATPRAARIPVVILTGAARDVTEAHAVGVEGYLLKPITIENYHATLEKLGLTDVTH